MKPMNDGLILKELSAKVTIPARVYVTDSETASSTDTGNTNKGNLILLIHGYGQTATEFILQMEAYLQSRATVAVQAPFPVLVKSAEGRQLGYTWYVYDSKSNTFQIPISAAVDFTKQVLGDLQLAAKITRIIGFSQGGYLAPFVALTLPSVKQIIGINCRFKHEDLLYQTIPFRLDAIHGADDELVDPHNASRSHAELLAKGCSGSFKILPKTTHEISPAVGQAVEEFLRLA
jgi:predicted esterase